MYKVNMSTIFFHNEDEARKYLESIRWQNGIVCHHCSNIGAYKIESKKARKGLYKCKCCSKQFTVTVGTLFERSKIPLHKWLTAVFLLCSFKKGMSSRQLHRILGITYKTAWYMSHRIREAMKDPVFSRQLGGEDTIVEVDETFWGNKGKYVRGEVHTNIIENFFSILKRGLVGTYQHVGAKHLKRYIGEFVFRYNNRKITDIERATKALMGIEGKRLMYRYSSQ